DVHADVTAQQVRVEQIVVDLQTFADLFLAPAHGLALLLHCSPILTQHRISDQASGSARTGEQCAKMPRCCREGKRDAGEEMLGGRVAGRESDKPRMDQALRGIEDSAPATEAGVTCCRKIGP